MPHFLVLVDGDELTLLTVESDQCELPPWSQQTSVYKLQAGQHALMGPDSVPVSLVVVVFFITLGFFLVQFQ